jgi:hypothetical protein
MYMPGGQAETLPTTHGLKEGKTEERREMREEERTEGRKNGREGQEETKGRKDGARRNGDGFTHWICRCGHYDALGINI